MMIRTQLTKPHYNKINKFFLIKRRMIVKQLNKKINKVFSSTSKKFKANYKIRYHVSGESFLTKPNKTVYMIKNVIKKSTKINPVLSTTGGTSDARFIKKISPCVEFGLIAKTIHQVD